MIKTNLKTNRFIKWLLSVKATLLVAAFILPSQAAAYSIVPEKCQGDTGCNICDIALAFVNFSNIIAGGLSGMALLFFIIGGFYFILSGGNEQRIETGRKILIGTVTGVLIVFLAWFAVNFVVRIAYQGQNNLESGEATVKVFDVDTTWWSLPACDPSLSGCGGKYVGESCGTVGSCANGGTGCTCFRTTDPAGDKLVCDGENGDAADSASATYKSKQCYCATPCDEINFDAVKNSAKKEYLCVTKEVYEVDQSSVKNYTKHDDISCASPDQVCVNKK